MQALYDGNKGVLSVRPPEPPGSNTGGSLPSTTSRAWQIIPASLSNVFKTLVSDPRFLRQMASYDMAGIICLTLTSGADILLRKSMVGWRTS